jgi:hypothetical protein
MGRRAEVRVTAIVATSLCATVLGSSVLARAAGAASAAAAGTTRVSVSADGVQGDSWCGAWAGFGWGFADKPAVSADGRQIAFASGAMTLVPGDTNGDPDVFVRDRVKGITTRVSVATDGGQGDLASSAPAISRDDRYVAFSSLAANLVGGDANKAKNVFVRDRVKGTTTRVSVAGDGAQGTCESGAPAISGTGADVAFVSCADHMVPGDSNGKWDVFVRRRA